MSLREKARWALLACLFAIPALFFYVSIAKKQGAKLELDPSIRHENCRRAYSNK